MKTAILITLSTLLAIAFTACGGGGGGGDNANFSNAEQKIAIDVNCSTQVTTTLINSYITMLSGDVLVRAENNTTVETYHDINGTKKVCRVSGSAYLIRK